MTQAQVTSSLEQHLFWYLVINKHGKIVGILELTEPQNPIDSEIVRYYNTPKDIIQFFNRKGFSPKEHGIFTLEKVLEYADQLKPSGALIQHGDNLYTLSPDVLNDPVGLETVSGVLVLTLVCPYFALVTPSGVSFNKPEETPITCEVELFINQHALISLIVQKKVTFAI